MMHDNITSQPAACYDQNIAITIPYYHIMIEEICDLVAATQPEPGTWLDTGCGSGTLVLKASERFKRTRFTLADPSRAMIELAQKKLAFLKDKVDFAIAGTEELDLPMGRYAVVTALISHHYFAEETRKKATQHCYNLLVEGGIYLNVETIKPPSEQSLALGLKRWREAQLRGGKAPEAVERHLSRYGRELKPITVLQHLELLKTCAFSTADLFWASYMQAGFYAIK